MSQEQGMRLVAEAEQLAGAEQALSQHLAAIDGAMRNTHAAIEAVRAASGEALMPVGAGVFVRARVEPDSAVVVSVGSGVAVEKGRDQALLYLEARSKELEAAAAQASARLGETRQRLERARAELDALASKMQAGGNV